MLEYYITREGGGTQEGKKGHKTRDTLHPLKEYGARDTIPPGQNDTPVKTLTPPPPPPGQNETRV